MARISRDVVDAVRDRTDIAEVVSRHVALQRRGRSMVGLCPFHNERSPSFHVIPNKGIFHCFGCQESGDVFKFLMKLEGLSFVEAVKELAGAAGIEIEERELSDSERRALKARATLYDVLDAATSFYESTLWTRPEGAAARQTLQDRGITQETARRVRLGYAPDGWTKLLDHLHSQGFPPERVREAGLSRERQAGNGAYDAFRDRLIIPIFDERNRVIAFGARLMSGEGPKYLNSPETPLYQKSHTLYGMQMARAGIQRKDRVLIVEGYFDVISLQQAGFEEAVATCGTALTEEHLARIKRLTRNVYVLLDADEAGQKAAERTMPLFLQHDLYPWRVEVPGAKDPDELIREQGAEAMEAVINRPEPLVEWVVSRRLRAYAQPTALGPNILPATRERVLEEMAPLLAQLPEMYLPRVAAWMGISEPALTKRLREQLQRPPGDQPPPAPPPEGWVPTKPVTHLLWLLVHRRDQVGDLLTRVPPTILVDQAPIQPIVARLLSGEPVSAILADCTDPSIARTLAAVVAREKLYDEASAPHALVEIVLNLMRPHLAARKAYLLNELEDAVRSGDTKRLSALTTERSGIVARERSLEQALRRRDLPTALQWMDTESQL